jgi:hypothetical protein
VLENQRYSSGDQLLLDGPSAVISDKIVRMPPPVPITDEDYRIVEESCRRLAARCQRKREIKEAARWERAADRIARARTPRCPD